MSTTPKILYLITKGTWGGAQRYVYDLATTLHNEGTAVVVAYGAPGELDRKLKEAGVRRVILPSFMRDVSFIREWHALSELIRLLRRERPSVLHINSSKAGGLGALAGRLAKVPHIVFTAHGWAFNEDRPRWQRAAFFVLHGVSILLAHETICVSQAVQKDFERVSFLRKKMQVIPLGIASKTLASQKEARKTLAPTFAAQTWIGVLAELHPTKRIQDAIDAFASIASAYKELGLVIIGEGQERGELTHRIANTGLTERIRLLGFVQNASAYLCAFDLMLLPSRSEALSYALIETGYASLPVIASKVGGIPEIIEDEVTGLLVPPLRSDLIAEKILFLLGHPEKAQAYGKALKTRVEKDFSFERMLAETKNVYWSVPKNLQMRGASEE
ncbi:MAG: glycosyltransferase [Minisyncoccia bacterium]